MDQAEHDEVIAVERARMLGHVVAEVPMEIKMQRITLSEVKDVLCPLRKPRAKGGSKGNQG